MVSLGIVVPAYRPDVSRLCSYVRALDERLAPVAILVELDAPQPGVVEAVERGPASVETHPQRRGKGAAIIAGFDRLVAGGELVAASAPDGSERDERSGEGHERGVLAFFDADASTPPESAAAVVASVVSGEADLATGSRRHPEATVDRHQTLGRRRLGDGFAWLARRFVEPSLYDYQCGAKALSADAWATVRGELRESGFGWDLELVVMVAALGYDVREVPIAWQDGPRSTVPPARTALALARALYRARRRAARLDASGHDSRPAAGGSTDEPEGGTSDERRPPNHNA